MSSQKFSKNSRPNPSKKILPLVIPPEQVSFKLYELLQTLAFPSGTYEEQREVYRTLRALGLYNLPHFWILTQVECVTQCYHGYLACRYMITLTSLGIRASRMSYSQFKHLVKDQN